jgi:hypothetical protein
MAQHRNVTLGRGSQPDTTQLRLEYARVHYLLFTAVHEESQTQHHGLTTWLGSREASSSTIL